MLRHWPIYSLLILGMVLTSTCPAQAAKQPVSPATLSERLGDEIDPQEAERYHLFPGISGFLSAKFYETQGSDVFVEYVQSDGAGQRTRKAKLSKAAWEATRTHVAIVEQYLYSPESATDGVVDETYWQRRLALKYAAAGRYDISRALIKDLPSHDDTTARAVLGLSRVRRAPFLPGSFVDRGGRTDLLVFAGYYGAWLSIATPIALGSDQPEVYGAALLLGIPVSLFTAAQLSKNSDISRGRASMISLGGHLGTWQGLGWAGTTDADGEAVVRYGLLAGLGGIAATALSTRGVEITEGHGTISGLALPWGVWSGLVVGVVAGQEDDDLLQTMLIASDVMVATAVIGARHSGMSSARARLISLAGFGGALAGFGIDLIGGVESGEAALGIAGVGSVGGLLAGVSLTKHYDAGRQLSSHASPRQSSWAALAPDLVVSSTSLTNDRSTPLICLRTQF